MLMQKGRENTRPFQNIYLGRLFFVFGDVVIGIRFRGDIVIAFRRATIDGIQLFIIHRLSHALQTHHVFIFRGADEDHALVLRPTMLTSETRVRTSVPASVIIMI